MARKQKLPPLIQTFSMVFVTFWIALFSYPAIWHLSIPDHIFRRYHTWRKDNKLVEDKVYPFADLLHLVSYPVHNAALKSKPERIAKLNPDAGVLNSLDIFQLTPLAYATYNSDLAQLQSFLEAGADPNTLLIKNSTALHVAVENCNEKAALLLLSFKARADLQNANGVTPLHICIQNSLKAAFMASLKTDFNLDLADNKGLTPLDYAIRQNSFEMVTALARAGASPTFSKASRNFDITLFLAQWQKTGNYEQAIEFVMSHPGKSGKADLEGGLPAEFPVDSKPETTLKQSGELTPDENL